MGKPRAFIEDGYDEDAYIAADPGIFEAVWFSFRPIPPRMVRDILTKFNEKSTKIQTDIIEAMLDKHVVSWSITNSKGSVVDVSLTNIRKLKKILQERIFNILTGYDPGDVDPLKTPVAPETEQQESDEDELARILRDADKPAETTLLEELVEAEKN